jgi:ApaG protein
MTRPFFYRQTRGIRITVRPRYLADQSRPSLGHFVFAYAVRIENVSPDVVQLISRFWRIHDSVGEGEDQEVRGAGVVGLQPTLAPGDVHEYQSYCMLKSPSGFMEGYYTFIGPERTTFEAEIPRFLLEMAGANRPEA